MSTTWRDRTIALAGVTQAVDMVDQLAKSGYLNTQDFETCVRSLFEISPANVEGVYGGVDQLQRGLDLLVELLANRQARPSGNQLLGYCLGIFHLQKRLYKNPKMLANIGARLEKAQQQKEHFGPTHDNVVATLADIYSETISTFQYRIQVVGEYQYLQQTRVANQVRVLLFAAIRAAALWRQTGGSRWQLLLRRNHLIETARQLQKEAKTLH